MGLATAKLSRRPSNWLHWPSMRLPTSSVLADHGDPDGVQASLPHTMTTLPGRRTTGARASLGGSKLAGQSVSVAIPADPPTWTFTQAGDTGPRQS
jgi:hypothetical protein